MRRTLVVTTLFVLFAGCGSATTPPVQSPGVSSGGTASTATPAGPTSTQPAESHAVGSGVPASPGSDAGTDLPVFGTAAFEADTSAAQKVTYTPADTASTSVSVTDAAGTFWYLSVPAGSLPRATTITMTPLKTIMPNGMPGPILGGILLEPAGTTLFLPATLEAYKGPAANAAVLTGDAQGAVRLAVPSGATTWKRVTVDHFSPWYVVDAADPAWAAAFSTLQQDGDAAAVVAATLVKQPLNAPAAPPIRFACPSTNGSGNAPSPIDAFVAQLEQPEGGLIVRLLAAAREQQLNGASGDDQLAVVGRLTDRLVRKASAMLKQTKPTSDTLLPAATAALTVGKSVELLGGDASGLLAAVTTFVDAALADSVKRISLDHDYQQAQVIWDIARMSALLGGGASLTGVDDAVMRALRFDANLRVDESNAEATWAIGGKVAMEYPGILSAGRDLLKGEATISDITYRDTLGLTLTPTPFDVHASLADVDICAGSATFGVDQFYMDNEVYKDEKGGGTNLGRSWINWTYFYGDKGGRDGWTWFAVKLHNGDAQWVNETVQAGDDGWFSEFSIILNHKSG